MRGCIMENVDLYLDMVSESLEVNQTIYFVKNYYSISDWNYTKFLLSFLGHS